MACPTFEVPRCHFYVAQIPSKSVRQAMLEKVAVALGADNIAAISPDNQQAIESIMAGFDGCEASFALVHMARDDESCTGALRYVTTTADARPRPATRPLFSHHVRPLPGSYTRLVFPRGGSSTTSRWG